jgi:hypothetical protein
MTSYGVMSPKNMLNSNDSRQFSGLKVQSAFTADGGSKTRIKTEN